MNEGTTLGDLRGWTIGFSFDPIQTSSQQKRSFMFRRFALLFSILTLALSPLRAGTIHEVFNQTYIGTVALSTTDLLTPPTVDRSYLITIYYSMSGTSSVGVKDTARPYFTWTDDVGTEQLGDGICPWNENGSPKKCALGQTFGPWLQPLQVYGGVGGTQTNAGPLAVTFPVRLLANSHLTLTIPVTNPDNLSYHVSVQIQGW
jgi:hypothetical protein